MNDQLRRAMAAVDDDIETAVSAALVVQPGEHDARQVQKQQEAEAQRQRDLDAALADAIEVVARQRARPARRTCTRHDGETVRRIFEALRARLSQSDSSDPGFP